MLSSINNYFRNTVSNTVVSKGYNYLFKNLLNNIKQGYLTIDIEDCNYPQYNTNSEPLKYGDPSSSLKSNLKIKDLYGLITKCMFGGDVGFGEAYVCGDYTSNDLTQLLIIMLYNRKDLDEINSRWGFLKVKLDQAQHYFNRNSLEGARRNMEAHYSLSNEIFGLILDKTMTYSSGYYISPDEPIEDAQLRKMRMLIDKANLDKDCHLLEIGSGWGSLAMEAVRRTGCRVTTISLSSEQVKMARERIDEAGLQDRIQVLLIDYREVTGTFDRIISCEMVENVGADNYPDYYKSIERCLKPDGIFVLQFIAYVDQKFERYKQRCDFVQKYIFPGGICPSLLSMVQAATDHSLLVVEDVENMGVHYAKTLNTWRSNLMSNVERVKELGFDQQFINKFYYYFSYCEAGFKTRSINDFQVVFSRPFNVKNLKGI
eukprot:gene522-659_t